MSAMDSRSVNVALPTLSVYFDASMAVVQWVPLAYQLTIVGLVLGMAPGRHVGSQKLYGFGFLLLALGSALCGLSMALWQMIVFRVVEAIGGAIILANGASASALYARESRGRALGMMSMAFHLVITGPSVGGFLVDTVGWRWIFFMNPAGGRSRRLDGMENSSGNRLEKQAYGIDAAGTTTLLISVAALIAGLQQFAKSGLGWFAVSAFVSSLVFCALLYYFERRAPVPLLDLSLFSSTLIDRGRAEPLLRRAVAHRDVLSLLPFYLQGILGFTPTEVGITIICFFAGDCDPRAGGAAGSPTVLARACFAPRVRL